MRAEVKSARRLPRGNVRHLQSVWGCCWPPGWFPAVPAKKMQCQQRRRQEKSVKIMQFMRYSWQAEQRFLAGIRTQGLTDTRRGKEMESESEGERRNTLGASCFACCVAVLHVCPVPLAFHLRFWQHKFANHVRDLRCNAALLLLLSCVLLVLLFVCLQSDSSSCSSCCCLQQPLLPKLAQLLLRPLPLRANKMY